MDGIKGLFDAYGRNARLYPAVLLMLPLFALPGLLTGIEKLSTGVVTGVVGLAVLYGLTHGVRALGKRAERGLVKRWGGLPTTRQLLWHDQTLDATTKVRYRNYLEAKGLELLSPDLENAHPARAREKAASAVTWLRNNRRADTYQILHSENAAYGFRRNLYGAKLVGVAIAVVATAISGWPIVHIAAPFWPASFLKNLTSIGTQERIGLSVSMACLLAWSFVVTPSWVREAAEQYAKALLETCDSAAA